MKTRNRRNELLRLASNGNDAAYAFLLNLLDASDLADDIEDHDPELPVGAMGKVLTLLASMPGNPFCMAHGRELAALMMTGALTWEAANHLTQRGDEYSARIEQAVFYVALVCCGYEKAREFAIAWANEIGE